MSNPNDSLHVLQVKFTYVYIGERIIHIQAKNVVLDSQIVGALHNLQPGTHVAVEHAIVDPCICVCCDVYCCCGALVYVGIIKRSCYINKKPYIICVVTGTKPLKSISDWSWFPHLRRTRSD